MYSVFQLGWKFVRYWFTASNGRGHGVHSPFVFEFITKVLRDKTSYDCYPEIENIRKILLADTSLLELEDFGAGSRIHPSYKRKVNQVASSSLKPKKFARLLYRMARFYQPSHVLELGTSLGVTTAYLASAGKGIPVTTMEGAKAVAAVARQHFQELGLDSINVIEGRFENTLPVFLKTQSRIDFAFIDGNHRKDPTIAYFEILLPKTNSDSILVFDDIHWSREMEEAWVYIQSHPRVTLTIDLFFIGIVFFRTEQKVKQHFSIRF